MDRLLRDIASFGHRFTGSAGERKAQKILLRRLRGWGLASRLQRFKVATWERGSSKLTVPSLKMDLPCLAMVFSGSTKGKARTYEVVDLFEGTPGDFRRNNVDLRGKAVLFSKKDYQEREKSPGMRRYETALQAGAKAFLVGTFRWPGVISTATLRLPDNLGPAPPALTLSGESVAALKRAMAAGAKRIAISTMCEDVSRFSGNVIAELPGQRSDQAVVLGAHLDTFDISTGADDNGSGVAVVCEVARLLATHKVKLLRPVRFVFFTGEELGRLGPDFWVRLQKTMQYRFPVLEIIARASDHYSFYSRGIPCLWEIAHRSGSRSPASLHHTPYDTLEYINPNELKEAATMAAKVVLYLTQRNAFPFRHFQPLPDDKVPHFS
jgi:Iap family predicted aminopeptidase